MYTNAPKKCFRCLPSIREQKEKLLKKRPKNPWMTAIAVIPPLVNEELFEINWISINQEYNKIAKGGKL